MEAHLAADRCIDRWRYREQGRKAFSPGELVILAVSIIGAVIGVVALVAGWITV